MAKGLLSMTSDGQVLVEYGKTPAEFTIPSAQYKAKSATSRRLIGIETSRG